MFIITLRDKEQQTSLKAFIITQIILRTLHVNSSKE